MSQLTDIDRPPAGSDGADLARFCSRCGAVGEHQAAGGLRARGGRVCEACGMGVVLRCSSSALPGAGAAFLIVTADLQVSAASEGAEPLFGLEEQVLGLDVRDLLISPLGEETFVQSLSEAARLATEPVTMPTRCTRELEATGMMAAKIATCGPPRAALVAVEPSAFGQR